MREHLRIALETGPRPWSMREIKLLGTMNDHELARRLRRAKHRVRSQRMDLHIPPFKPRAKWRYWKPWERKLLGTMPDAELAQQLDRSFYSVEQRRAEEEAVAS